jgi:hypothetical protein
MTGSDLGGGDLRTLAFASLRIDEALLQKLMAYQRALAAEATRSGDAASVAAAHAGALAAAGLPGDSVERPLAVLRRFVGNRETAARLRAAEAGLEGERRDALRARLAALDAELTERDDPETIARLLAHEDELLALHRSTREADSR